MRRTFREIRKPNAPYDESGAVFPLLAVMSVLLIGIVGLVLDLSRIEATIRRAQTAADAGALAGATLLETEKLTDVEDEIDDWARVKRTVLLTVANSQMLGVNAAARASLCMDSLACTPTFRFDDTSSTSTAYDCPDYDFDSGQRGNLRVKTRRLLYCYWQEPWADPATAPITRQVFNVENDPNHFCKANAVAVDLTLSEVKTTFSRVLGISDVSDITVGATAYMEEPIPIAGSLCSSVNCDSIGIRDLMEAKGLIPSPEPTPWPATSPPPLVTTPCGYAWPFPAPTCP